VVGFPAVEPPESPHVTPDRDSVSYLGIGTGLAVTLLLAMGVGYWLDERFGTGPVFILAGAAFGMFAVFYHLYKAYKSTTGGKP
jgi:F0F1-type ATP synthase assembly protein I